jgi:hypothetical protein
MPRYHGSAVSICFCLGTPEITPMCIGETATSWVYQRCWHVDHMFSTVFILQTWYFCWAWPLDLLLIPLRGDIWFLWAWPCEFDFKRLQQTWLTIEWDAGCLDISWHILTSQNCFLSAVYSIHPFNILFPLFKAVSEEPWSHLEPWRPWRCCLRPAVFSLVIEQLLTHAVWRWTMLNHGWTMVEPRLLEGSKLLACAGGLEDREVMELYLGLFKLCSTLVTTASHISTYDIRWYPRSLISVPCGFLDVAQVQVKGPRKMDMFQEKQPKFVHVDVLGKTNGFGCSLTLRHWS